jgi:hypothetical protein
VHNQDAEAFSRTVLDLRQVFDGPFDPATIAVGVDAERGCCETIR